MPKSKSFFLVEGGACLATCGVLAIFGLIFAQNEVSEELFNSLMTGFVWTFAGGASVTIIGCCIESRREARQIVATSDPVNNPQSQNELGLENIEQAKQSVPEQIVAVVIPRSQKHKYEPLGDADLEGIELGPLSLTPKSRVSA